MKESIVYLDPIPHVYVHRETGEKYTSVTTVISTIEEDFDVEGVADKIAKMGNRHHNEIYHGMSKEQIIEYWTSINVEATEKGTEIHEILEEYLLRDKWFFPKNDLEKAAIEGYDSLNVDEGIKMHPEKVLFAEEFKIAGTADLVIDINDVFFDVGDWKGLSIETPIFTNKGWKTMGDINVGDKVYDMDGDLVSVKHTSNIKYKECYRIKFDNNDEIIADFEHRWLISFYRDKKFKDVVMTTKELFDYVSEMNLNGKRWSHKIPKIKTAKRLNNEYLDLPINPYVFGVWLGDGHSADGKITNMNNDVWGEIKRRGYTIGEDVSQGGAGKATTRTIFGLRTKLREYGLLNNKHIPDIFLQSSYEQRLDILRGFMDADGHYNESRKRFVMSTTRKWQSDAFEQLVSTLGIKPTVINYDKMAMGKMVNVYDILFSTESLNPFLVRNKDNIVYGKQNNRDFKNITTVELVPTVPTRCIEVDSPTHTFLFGYSFTITHNTNKVLRYYNEFGNKTLLPPFDHLQDCEHNIYSLQLSVYALMYEMETGRKCRHIWIGHFDKTTHKMTKIAITYLKHEAKQLLKYYKYQNQLKF